MALLVGVDKRIVEELQRPGTEHDLANTVAQVMDKLMPQERGRMMEGVLLHRLRRLALDRRKSYRRPEGGELAEILEVLDQELVRRCLPERES